MVEMENDLKYSLKQIDICDAKAIEKGLNDFNLT